MRRFTYHAICAALEAEALAQASEETRQHYENPVLAKFRGTLMLGLLREHLAGKLARDDSMLF